MQQKVKCLLVDDEFFALELMENYLNRLSNYEIVDKLRNPLVAYDVLRKQNIDLLFLDIQMPHINGISLLKNLDPKPVTIFTTAYKQFAADAFELDAADYLQKPFTFERFNKALDKANLLLNTQTAEQEILTIRSDRKWINIPHNEILFIEGMKEYVKIHTINNQYMCLESLAVLEEKLPMQQFLRTHKSYIVNIKHIQAFGGDSLMVNNFEIAISRNRKQDVLDLIKK